MISESHPYIPIINPTLMKPKNCSDYQFGLLYTFSEKYLITFYADVLLIIDPDRFQIVGSCQELKSILDISVYKNEIFILESNRNIVRLSDQPDYINIGNGQNETQPNSRDRKLISDIMSVSLPDFQIPKQSFNYISSKLKETSRALPKINSSFLNTLKEVFETDIEFENGQYSVIPPIIPLKESSMPDSKLQHEDCMNSSRSSSITSNYQPLQNPSGSSESRFRSISSKPYQEILVSQYNPKKKKCKSTSSQHSKNREKRTHKTKSTSLALDFSRSDSKSMSDSVSVNSFQSSTSEKISSQNREKNISVDPMIESNDLSNLPNNDSAEDFKEISCGPINSISLSCPTVSSAELELKEELLARRLNWPELLPPSAESSSIKLDKEEIGHKSCHSSDSENYSALNDPLCTEKRGDDSQSIASMRFLDDSSISGASVSLAETSSMAMENVDSFTESVDIYSKYKGSSIDSCRSSFYGPPSGSSNLLGDSTSLLDAIDLTAAASLEFVDETNGSGFETDETVIKQVTQVEPQVGNDSWLQYQVPSYVTNLTACDHYIVCVETRGLRSFVYYTGLNDLTITWKKLNYEADEVAMSPSGKTVWRIWKSRVYSLMSPSLCGPYSSKGTDGKSWKLLTEDVSKVGLTDTAAWILKNDGIVYAGHLNNYPSPKWNPYKLDAKCVQITVRESSVWVLTCGGRVFYRNRMSLTFPFGTEWLERKLSIEKLSSQVCTICHGPKSTIWFVTYNGDLYFICGVSTDFPGGNTTLWKVFVGDYVYNGIKDYGSRPVPFSLTSLRNTLNALKPSRMYNMLTCKPVALLASTNSSIWFSVQCSSEIYVNKTEVSGITMCFL